MPWATCSHSNGRVRLNVYSGLASQVLPHCGLMTPHGVKDVVHFGSGKGCLTIKKTQNALRRNCYRIFEILIHENAY